MDQKLNTKVSSPKITKQAPQSSCATDLNNPTMVNQNCKRTIPVRAKLINLVFYRFIVLPLKSKLKVD